MLFRCDQERACERIADLDDPVFAVLYGVGLWFCIVVDDRDILLKGWLTCAVLILFIFYSPDQLSELLLCFFEQYILFGREVSLEGSEWERRWSSGGLPVGVDRLTCPFTPFLCPLK